MTTATATEPALSLVSLLVDNFMRLTALRVDANGHHVVISGKNSSGKASALEAIWTALCGASMKKIPEPIHKGEERASIRLDLGKFVVTRRWSKSGGTTLTVTAADGNKISQPQELLNGLLSKFSLDPVEFLDLRPQDQVDQVLTLAGVAPPVAHVEEIVGERHEPKPGESADKYLMRLSADETGVYYVRRRDVWREWDQKKKALNEQSEIVRRLGGPVNGDGAEESASGIVAEIEAVPAESPGPPGGYSDGGRSRRRI